MVIYGVWLHGSPAALNASAENLAEMDGEGWLVCCSPKLSVCGDDWTSSQCPTFGEPCCGQGSCRVSDR